MQQSPTEYPSVITIEHTDGYIPSVTWWREKKNWRA